MSISSASSLRTYGSQPRHEQPTDSEVPAATLSAVGRSTALLPRHSPPRRVPATAQRLHLEGFRAWATSEDSPDKAKLTFLNGQVTIDLSGEEIQASTLVKTAVCAPLAQIVLEEDLGLFSIDSTLVSNVAAEVSNIPDALLVTWDSLEAGRARLVQDPERPERYREIEGTPDWVLEIVSDSSVGKDTRDLLAAYHHAGIREYWLIDARGDDIHFTISLHQAAGYAPAPQRGGWQRSPVFRRRFRLVRRRGRMGLWRYTLDMKATR